MPANFGDEPDDEEVSAQLEAVQAEIDGLDLENQIFEHFLQQNATLVTQLTAEKPNASAKGKGKAADANAGKLTAAQKSEIGTAHLDTKKKEMEDSRKASEKLVDTLRAVLEETETRIAELKKDAYEFKRDVVVGGENPRTGRTVAEKVTKYMEEKLEARDRMIDKLKLKNGSLKAAVAAAEAELKAKEEAGDVLHYIDFHQLQIENKQHTAKLEGLSADVLALKATSSHAAASLAAAKQQLAELGAAAQGAAAEASLRAGLLDKLGHDIDRVAAAVAAERRTMKRLAQDEATGGGGAGDGGGMPQVLDYVAQKAEMFDLETVLKTWTKKVDIMEMAAKRVRALQNQAQTQAAR